jgi:hypothetical protein
MAPSKNTRKQKVYSRSTGRRLLDEFEARGKSRRSEEKMRNFMIAAFAGAGMLATVAETHAQSVTFGNGVYVSPRPYSYQGYQSYQIYYPSNQYSTPYYPQYSYPSNSYWNGGWNGGWNRSHYHPPRYHEGYWHDGHYHPGHWHSGYWHHRR